MTQSDHTDPLRRTLVASRERWLSTGVSAQRLRTLVAAGDLIKVRNGAYATKRALAWAQDDPRRAHVLHVYAAMDRRGNAVASHESAAVMHGIDLFRHPGDTVSLTLPPGSRPGRKAGVSVHAAALPAGQVTTMYRVRTTSLARTVADLARTLPFMEAVVVADSALHTDRVSESEILGVLKTCAQWPGVRQAERVVEFADPNAESVLESCGRVILHERGLEEPQVQATITGPDYRYTADLYYPPHKTIVEFDGMQKYSDERVLRKQFERDRVLRDAGYKIVHVTWRELFGSPDNVVERIRKAFAAPSPF
jgi:very-short-patch-repair endonuclease